MVFPYTYIPDVLESYLQWSEMALCQALLVNNNRLKILFSLSMIHHARPDALKQIFPSYKPAFMQNGLEQTNGVGDFPSSTYLVTN